MQLSVVKYLPDADLAVLYGVNYFTICLSLWHYYFPLRRVYSSFPDGI